MPICTPRFLGQGIYVKLLHEVSSNVAVYSKGDVVKIQHVINTPVMENSSGVVTVAYTTLLVEGISMKNSFGVVTDDLFIIPASAIANI